ncbi:MAG: transcription termination factor NusA [Deferribacteres bacterium]|nr:transcription termination factor NusA [candidate division KSB1 bacterium]MCB9501336.1 transcription termination factor NusA [Deferribacteres bacterium]
MNSEIANAFSQIVKEKNVEKDQLSEIVESIVISMITKKYGTADNFDIFVNLDKGEIEIYQNKVIVETVVDPVTEIDLESARKVEASLEVGDDFIEILDPTIFGRRLITSAKQNLNQRIKDVEKDVVYAEFNNRIGEIILGDIRQINRNDIFLLIDRTEALLPRNEQIESERYHRGESVRVLVKEVRKSARGPEVIVSRADPKFLIRLFELEVPEIYDGIIEIKSVARQPGERSKIAVFSNDKRIDPVGACVGMKGIRIQAVSKELNNEKIDIIPFSTDPVTFISRALSPAKPIKVIVNEENKSAVAVIPDEQVSISIGKGGMNRRLTSRLTGYNVEILKDSEYNAMIQQEKEKEETLEDIEGLRPSIIEKLHNAQIFSVHDIIKLGKAGLMAIEGIGEKTIEKIFQQIEE